jgi:Haem degrading protein HbpS-like/PIN domain
MASEFSRMDGAALLSVQVAQDNAYTAVGFGMPTDGWHDFIKDDPPLAAGAVGGIDRLVIFGGGCPIQGRRSRRRSDWLATADALIAATADAHQLPLITRDCDFANLDSVNPIIG